jgi:ribosome-binding protein aMBF1 (putative translation factor)
MITNERQYRITKAEADRFAEALAHVEEENQSLHPRLRRAMRESLESELEDLREQLAAYEALRDGDISVIEVGSLTELPAALIRARTAVGLTQRALAERLGLKEQQIQRYEATGYAGASLERLQAVADGLGVMIEERVVLPAPSSKTHSG